MLLVFDVSVVFSPFVCGFRLLFVCVALSVWAMDREDVPTKLAGHAFVMDSPLDVVSLSAFSQKVRRGKFAFKAVGDMMTTLA